MTHVESSHSTRSVAGALFTAQWVVSVQVEVAGHTLITYPPHHTLLTLTQLTFDDLTTPSQGVPRDLLGSSRVTVTFFTHGVVVESLLTLATAQTVEGRATLTLSTQLFTGLSVRSVPVTVTGSTVWVAVEAWMTPATGTPSKVWFTWTLTILTTHLLNGARLSTLTLLTRGVVIVTRCTAVTAREHEVLLTQTLARCLVTDLLRCSRRVTVTQGACWVIVIAMGTLVALLASKVKLAWTLPSLHITVVVCGSPSGCLTGTRSAFWEVVVS